MFHDDLIATAKELVVSGRGRPRNSNLRRAVSTAYYALFHCLAADCADLLVGGRGANRSDSAWRQTYRALEHGTARSQCEKREIDRFPSGIQDFANIFVRAQPRRHAADYDPRPHRRLKKSEVEQDIRAAEYAIRRLRQSPVRDRRAFAIYVLLRYRAD